MVTIIITIALGVVTIVLALKLARKRQPVWAYKTTKIIGLGSDAPPELKLTFNERLVSDVYQTRLIFFNKGNEPILKDDVTEGIVIHFEEADILRQPTILAMSRKGIEVSVKQVVRDGDNAIEIDFKYLDHNDGAVIEVLHTTSQGVKASGNIIGTNKIRYIGEFVPSYDRPLVNVVMRMALYVVMPIVAIGVLFWPSRKEEIPNESVYIVVMLVLLFYMIGLGVAPFIRVRRFPRWSVVKS